MEENLTTQFPQISKIEKGDNKTKKILKVLIAFLTIGVISMLLVSGPADAYTLNLTSDKTTVNQGDEITFNVDLNINVDNGEYSKINTITLKLEGPETKYCVFNVSGNIVSECEGVKLITLTSSIDENSLNFSDTYYGYTPQNYSNYGYFYGYGYNKVNLNYKIVLDTTNYSAGIYNNSVKVVAGNEIIEYSGKSIEIKEQVQNTNQVTRERGGNSRSIKIENGITQKMEIEEGDVFSIYSNIYIHELEIKKITDDTITFVMKSEYQEFMLKVGETKELDLDEDGEMDASISIWYIGKNGEGSMFMIQSYNSIITQKQIKKTLPPQVIKGNLSSSYTSYSTSERSFDKILSDYSLIIILVTVNLFVLIMLIIIISFKKGSKKSKKVQRKPLRRY
ncbi:MAG TPA: hypothetical protein P5277_02365 [Candidatus Paceibacterota bacterium]|nr:hypothetical protein [Candidatus Paceibacterota bacterium]